MAVHWFCNPVMAVRFCRGAPNILRGSYSGNTLAFQAKARSSILLPRSTTLPDRRSIIGKVVCHKFMPG